MSLPLSTKRAERCSASRLLVPAPGLACPRDLVGLYAVDQARAPPRGLPSLGPLSSHSTRLPPPATVYLGKGACWAWLQEQPREQPQTNRLLPQKPKLAELESLPAPEWPDPPPPPEGQLRRWVSGWMCGGKPGSQVSGTPREATGTGAQARGLSWTPGMAANFGVSLGHSARQPFTTLPWGRIHTSPLPGALAGQPEGPTAREASGAVFTPRLAGAGEGKALKRQDAKMLGPKEQQT